MRRKLAHIVVAAIALGSGCGEPSQGADGDPGLERLLALGPAFVQDPAARREALEESLVDPSNGYSRLRLEEYGHGDRGWDALEERNFPVRPTVLADLGRFVDEPFKRSVGAFEPVYDPETFEWSDEALRELGKRAFHEYPLSLDTTLPAAFASESAAREAGLWQDGERVGGFVRARLDDGSEMFAATCASCHASTVDGELVDGRTNPDVDRSRISRMFHGIPGTDWGPGRVDVTDDGVRNPTAVTDLRAIRHQNRLHWAATLHNSPEALAVRVETLMITSAKQAARPPREVAVAIAYYLWSLGEEPSEPVTELPGAAVFEANCAACHDIDGSTASPVAIEVIGTDPSVGQSPMRGTGHYRIPSLYRVGSRSQFLHEGKVKALEELFDPARLEEVPGHVHGTNLTEDERRELVEFLETL